MGIIAYCFPLLAETVDGHLSRGRRQLNGIYTQKFSRRHHESGHLFQGRYKAILVKKETYLLELTSYVVLNPVRARMVKRPEDWAWSSFNAMIGTDRGESVVRCRLGVESIWER